MGQEDLASFRYRMLVRGYMNKTQLKTFMDCGAPTAKKAWDEMKSQQAKEGVETLNGGYILTTRAMAFLGLSEKKIVEAYERQKRCSPQR